MSEAQDASAATHGLGAVSGTLGGAGAVAISILLAISLPVRNVDFNALNLFTIVLGAVAGLLAIGGSRRDDGGGLGWAAILLLVAIVPTVFGWVILLYLPAFVAILVAVTSFVTKPSNSH